MKTGTILARLGLNSVTAPFNLCNAFHLLHSGTTDRARLLFVGASFFFSATCGLLWLADHFEGVPEHALESQLEAENIHDEEEI